MTKIVKRQRETTRAPSPDYVDPMTAIQPALDGSVPPAKVPAARRKIEDFEEWVDEVWQAFEDAADSGLPFTVSEIAEKRNLPDPPNPQAHWGKLPGRLRKAGLIEEYATGRSSRDSVHSSLVVKWIGIPQQHRRAAA
ncbi:hypothetical protein OG539_32610 [Actinacidiphila glaucinigra]|uniref:hypothetical protein n=1 Tax=Actinacidiphila glaucinigra TaxID=235986 RepID=UPI0032528780